MVCLFVCIRRREKQDRKAQIGAREGFREEIIAEPSFSGRGQIG